MIIGHDLQYVFVQLPHTGSTAVAEELRKNYGGCDVLKKHSTFHELERVSDTDVSDYFIFSTVRNPLDEVVSIYYRLKRDHMGMYSDPSNYVQTGGWVTPRARRRFRLVHDRNAEFEDFVRRFYKLPYTNWSLLEHREFDLVMRFERLQDGFATALQRIGAKQVRELPRVNRTDRPARSLSDHYPPSLRPYAAKVFGPYMNYWGYRLPDSWDVEGPSRWDEVLFRLLSTLKSVYWSRKESLRRFVP